MFVSDILKNKGRTVVSAQPDQLGRDVVRMMAERSIGSVLVMDQGGIAGIVSERDIVNALARNGNSALDEPVGALMTANVVTCEPGDSISSIMEMMTTGRFRHVPVMEDGRLEGLISIGDVVKHRLQEAQTEMAQMTAYVQGSV